jgi:hypothetical protein
METERGRDHRVGEVRLKGRLPLRDVALYAYKVKVKVKLRIEKVFY